MTAQSPRNFHVLVEDDHPPTWAGIRSILERARNIYIAGEVQNFNPAFNGQVLFKNGNLSFSTPTAV